MRKFKLRDQVAKKMKGLDNTIPDMEKTVDLSNTEDSSADSGTKRDLSEMFRVISRTDIGLIRKSNQDAVINGSGLMGVADGMGGHNGGETASASARDGMIREISGMQPCGENLEKAIRNVNLQLWEMQLQDDHLSGMGTTLTVLWPSDEKMWIGHVGDSRAYLIRSGEMRQVTDDHSMVADMVRRGILTEEQAACHPMRNYITRAVGTESGIRADILSIPRQAGDRWLVCSDGLHGTVDQERLRELMCCEDLDEAADQMVREALDQGGRDNITLVIAEDFAGGMPAKIGPENHKGNEDQPEKSRELAPDANVTGREASE